MQLCQLELVHDSSLEIHSSKQPIKGRFAIFQRVITMCTDNRELQIHTYMQTCNIHTYIHTYNIHTYIHTYIHTHTYRQTGQTHSTYTHKTYSHTVHTLCRDATIYHLSHHFQTVLMWSNILIYCVLWYTDVLQHVLVADYQIIRLWLTQMIYNASKTRLLFPLKSNIHQCLNSTLYRTIYFDTL